MLKALFTGDLHISNSLPYAKKDPNSLISDRLFDLVKLIHWIIDEARMLNLPLFILGDIFDQKRPDSVSLKTVIQILNQACNSGVPVYILPGNHEAPNERGLHYVVDALKEANIDGLTILEAGKVLEIDGFNICPVPYRSKTSTLELIQQYKELENPKILLLHDMVIGTKVSGHLCEDGISVNELNDFSLTVCGHVHDRQSLDYPYKDGHRTIVIYPGSPFQINFGDVGKPKSILKIEAQGHRPQMIEASEIKVPCEWSEQFYQGNWQDNKLIGTGNLEKSKYIKIIYKGTDEEFIQHKNAIEQKINEIKRRQEVKKIMLVHRKIFDVGLSRLDVNILNGLPPTRELIKQYVDCVYSDGDIELVEAGIMAMEQSRE